MKNAVVHSVECSFLLLGTRYLQPRRSHLLPKATAWVVCVCVCVIVSVLLASNVVDRGFKSRSGQCKYYKIGIC